jgi:hypothetical protein
LANPRPRLGHPQCAAHVAGEAPVHLHSGAKISGKGLALAWIFCYDLAEV